MKKMQGSISIYLALIFTVVLSLIGVLIESARYQSADAATSIITNNGLESAFGGYASPLLSDYGLFFTWQGDAQFTESIKGYIENNISGELNDEDYVDLLNLKLSDVEVTNIKHATDKRGTYFANQVSEFMRYKGVSDMAEKLIEYFEKAGDLEGLKDILKKIKKAKEKIEEISKSVCDLYEIYEFVKETGEDINEDIKTLKKEIKALKKDIEKFKDGDEGITGENIIEDYNSIVETADNLKNDLTDLYNLKDSGKESFDTYLGYKEESDEIYSAIKETISDTEELTEVNGEKQIKTDEDTDDKVINSWEVLEDILRSLDENEIGDLSLEDINTDTINDSKFLSKINKKIKDLESDMGSIKNVIKSIKDINYGDSDEGNIEELDNESMLGVSANGIIDFIEGFKDDFVLGMLTDVTKVSGLSIKKESDCPSSEIGDKSADIDLIDEGLYAIYAKDYMSCFLDESDKDEEKSLSYEMEYIYAGMDSDKKNLSKVGEKLIELREINNIVAILGDSEKMTEVRNFANMTFGLAQIPAITILGEIVIIAAWALGESVLDVRNLFAGGKIKFIKTGKDFTLSLGTLPSVISGGIDVDEKNYKDDADYEKIGLDYKNFLSILIMLQGKGNKYARGMDIIEFNLKRKYNDDFKMKNCICGASLKIKVKVDELFLHMLVSKDINDGAIKGVEIEKEVSFEY